MDYLPFQEYFPGRNTRPKRPQIRRYKSHDQNNGFCWQYVLIKVAASAWLLGIVWLCWPVLTSYYFKTGEFGPDLVYHNHDFDPNYFESFQGHAACPIALSDLYDTPQVYGAPSNLVHLFCKSRADLLEAMSGGGRRGFDGAYSSKSCQHRWYSPEEICMVLERFENVIFIGDTFQHSIYAAVNNLLRKDLGIGALRQWNMTNDEVENCQCDNQFFRPECARSWVDSSQELVDRDVFAKYTAPFICPKANLHYLPLNTSTIPSSHLNTLKTLIPVNKKAYRPIPIIHSLTYSTTPPLSHSAATDTLYTLLRLADTTKRKTPILSLGPTAPSHLQQQKSQLQISEADAKTSKSSRKQQQLSAWDFSTRMQQSCKDHDVEWLGMWNMTVQASSVEMDSSGGDGKRTAFGLKVAITQAMMVVNWLARLESS